MSKIDDVIALVDAGQQPIIRFLKDSTSGGLDKGQYARVEKWEDDTLDANDITYIWHLNFSEFWQYNQQIDRPIYYNPVTADWDAKWHETKGYPTDHRETYYLSEDECDEFEIVDCDTDLTFLLHCVYINVCSVQSCADYQSWLEKSFITALKECDNIEMLRDGVLTW